MKVSRRQGFRSEQWHTPNIFVKFDNLLAEDFFSSIVILGIPKRYLAVCSNTSKKIKSAPSPHNARSGRVSTTKQDAKTAKHRFISVVPTIFSRLYLHFNLRIGASI